MTKEKIPQKGFLLYESIAKKIIEDIKKQSFFSRSKAALRNRIVWEI